MIDLESRNALGRTGFSVSPLCVGTSSWGKSRPGEPEAAHRRRVTDIAHRVLGVDPVLNYIDTSNIYGDGMSEVFIGESIRAAGGIPGSRVVQTKLDRKVDTNDFSAGQMWRSLEQSLERLGVDTLQILFIHDPENIGFAETVKPGGPLDALLEMKQQGIAAAIGISGGPVPLLQRFVDTDLFDMIITHNRFTLVDRSATALLETAKSKGMGVNNAAPYGGGALSGRPGASERYGYRPAGPEVHSAILAMTRLCESAGVSLSAAALQFSLRNPLVDSTVVGASSIDRVDAAIADAAAEIPEDLWAELDKHLPPASTALDASYEDAR